MQIGVLLLVLFLIVKYWFILAIAIGVGLAVAMLNIFIGRKTPQSRTIEIHIRRGASGHRFPAKGAADKVVENRLMVSEGITLGKVSAVEQRNGIGGRRLAPTRGLVIMRRPLDQILAGKKTLELRSKHNRQLGPVALIMKGSGCVYATANITESIGPMTESDLRARSHEHGVEPERISEVFEKGWGYGWRLRNVLPLGEPVPYIHKGMSQIKLDSKAIEGIQAQLDEA